MTTVIFIRHGPTKENGEDRIQGHQHGQLLLRETEQYISAITPLMRKYNPSVLLSSDLKRAEATCYMLKEFLQIEDVEGGVLELLRERSMGQYEGKLWKDIPQLLQNKRRKYIYDFRSYGGESDEEVKKRVRTLLRYLAEKYTNECICCVTHAGWLQQLGQVAREEGISPIDPDSWINRSAIYEASLDNGGCLQYLYSIPIEAKLPRDNG